MLLDVTVFDWMNSYNQFVSAFDGVVRLLTSKEIKDEISQRFGTNPGSVIPSDFCYNRWNKGANDSPLFVRVGQGEYRYLGPDVPHTCLVYWRPRCAVEDVVVGERVNGTLTLYDQNQGCSEANSTDVSETTLPGVLALSQSQIELLYEKYMEILALEVGEFGCQPTETRHLLGRLGEFYCARMVDGTLASQVNQAGFDVIGKDGRRISVKTTAQVSGVVSINGKTANRADDLMVLRYTNGEFRVVFHGEIGIAIDAARPYQESFELDLSRAIKLPTRIEMLGEQQ